MKQGLLKVDVANRQRIKLPIGQIKAIARDVLRQEGKEGRISLVFVDDYTIKELNKRFLGKDKPTDVLAFPLSPEQTPAPLYLGEVIISTERAKKQAEEYGISFIEEIYLLLIHGLLHLLGYKHSKKMREKENFFFSRF